MRRGDPDHQDECRDAAQNEGGGAGTGGGAVGNRGGRRGAGGIDADGNYYLNKKPISKDKLEAEIKRIGRAEALDFYQHHYAPNNATVIVAGDVKPDEVLKLAQQNYEPVAARSLAPRMSEPSP